MSTRFGPLPESAKNAGTSPSYPATSPQTILLNYPNSQNGSYYINLPTVGSTKTYCLMTSSYDGGGWMLALKANTTATTFNYDANYWTAANTLNASETNRNAGDAKFDCMNYFAAKDMLAIWPDITTGTGGSITGTGQWTWLQNDFYGGTRTTLISFFNTVDRYFIRDAKTYSGWASGIFSSQADVRFYGYNYRNNPGTARTRWGFGWNENGGGLYPNGNMDSDDVSGGIGMMPGTWQGYSAGDRISCCQDSTGINRAARVEIYIR
jgi:hypothetical protein